MISTINVKADRVRLKMDYQSGVYYTRKGNGLNDSWQYIYYSLDGIVAYCIEPGVEITNLNYITGDLSNSPYSEEKTNRMELIGYYGYEYPNHQTQKYRMATQALIWETARNIKVEFYTQRNGGGSKIDITKERNEIMRLVNSHYDKPSFNGQTFETTYKEEIKLEDTNNVLGNFEIIDDGGNTVSIDGNTLSIIGNTMEKTTIRLQKKKYDSKTTIIYTGEDGKSQKMGFFRFHDPIKSNIVINTTGGVLTITKVDSETQTNVPQGNATLKGATYGIYDSDDILIEKITTDENGMATTNPLNKLGEFYAKELSSSQGYLIDNTKYYFEILEEDLTPKITVEENVIKGNFNILKLYGMEELIPEENITFDVYLKSNNKLIQSVTTDKDGVLKTSLPYGTYIVKQKNTMPNYELSKDFEITINENDQTISKNIVNKPLSAKLKIVKIDEDTKEVVKLSGIKFKIKDLSTNEYVCQKITYPKATIVCEYETDDSGVFITPNELLGDFEIEEVKSQKINGYLWNSEKIKVHIGDNSNFINDEEYGKIVVAEFTNKKVKGKIEIYKLGEKLHTKNDNQMLRSIIQSDVPFINDIISFDEIPLANVKFGLYKEDDTLVREEITDNNGYICFDDLELGKYYVKELSVSDLYVVDDTKHEFNLEYIDQFTPVVMNGKDIRNYLKKGTLEFTKTDLVNGNPIPNTKMEFYTSDDKLIYSGITDKDGKITIPNLPIGKYYIKEKEATTGYLLSNEIVYFEIKENGEIVRANMTNKKITGTIELTKVDVSTSKPLPNTLLEIYNANSDELLFSERTDENGKIIIPNLEYGDYYIVESEAPEGYILNDEKMYFSIKEDGEIVKATITNEKIIINVPKTYKNDDFLYGMIALGTIGLGIIIYGISKKRKEDK